jgi:outer membrane protein assembly factor BamB
MLAAFAFPGVAAAGTHGPALSATACPDVAHHEDPAHDGYNCSALPASVTEKWSVTLNGAISFPLIVDGRVFVTSAGSASGGSLYALSATTGKVLWGPVALTDDSYLPLAFGGGQVYVSPFEGPVTAFNAATGGQVWATSLGATDNSEPVVGGSLVWVEGTNDAYGLNEKTGLIATDTGSLDGDGAYADPAVKGQGLYISTGCQKQYGYNVKNGIFRWEHNSNCTEGGGGSAAIWAGRMYGSDGNEILATADGTLKGTFSGTPAFSGTTGFFAWRRTLSALDVAAKNKPVWTANLRASISAGPIATPAAVWVGTKASKLVAISPTTGAVLATYSLPGIPGLNGSSVNPADIGIGNNLIVVPTESTLTAFGS